ncbi:MAG: hypothetical protein A2X84_00425 [Desulfuromonadaceae bacterium GWC2_58_13]|nr:MAG: hypothetical protein A2X84_00425 [Desulfuromonadaceae bacterium GWC2_58_13]
MDSDKTFHRSARIALVGSLQNCLTLVFLTALLVVGPWVAPSSASECDTCIPCHGNLEDIHGDFNHSAAPGSGPVLIFDDTDHDDAGWVGSKPYFDITVDCDICHHTDLPAVHGNDCATCHPTPYDTLGIWGKGCQQGGCHPFYHQDSTVAHLDFEDPYHGGDCNICHNQYWSVPQTQCLNCHSAYKSGDVTPPVSTSTTQAEYVGPAKIDFSIKDNGKVGVGRIFYRLDGGTATAAGKYLFVTAPGPHELEFWSMDQSGNTESAPNNVFFNILADTTPPTTTSNAQPSYNQGAVITLTATDASTLGVKKTYYRLNDGAIQSGTRVGLPATSGTIAYTLAFWSEDWAGNIETQNSVSFTVTSGTGKIRLVWGNSDETESLCSDDPEASAAWTIKRGSWSGPVVASGSGGCPNWDGVDDITVLVGSIPYFVTIDWWDSYYGYDDQTVFSNVNVATPGQVLRLSY